MKCNHQSFTIWKYTIRKLLVVFKWTNMLNWINYVGEFSQNLNLKFNTKIYSNIYIKHNCKYVFLYFLLNLKELNNLYKLYFIILSSLFNDNLYNFQTWFSMVYDGYNARKYGLNHFTVLLSHFQFDHQIAIAHRLYIYTVRWDIM